MPAPIDLFLPAVGGGLVGFVSQLIWAAIKAPRQAREDEQASAARLKEILAEYTTRNEHLALQGRVATVEQAIIEQRRADEEKMRMLQVIGQDVAYVRGQMSNGAPPKQPQRK